MEKLHINQADSAESGPIVEAKSGESAPEVTGEKASAHAEAVKLVEDHRELFEHYARGAIKVEPAPEGLNTFAFDLKKNTIYVNARFYKELGFSEEKTTFATLHEIEHLQEKIAMLAERNGEKKFDQYLKKIEGSQAYSIMDNCVADIRENRTVVSRTHQGFQDIERKCYREDLFKETDFTSQPQHLQLPYTLIREARVPDEKCTVAPEVREKLNALRAIGSRDGRTKLLDIMTHPDTPMSTRLKLQDKYVWPLVEELLKEDEKREDQKHEQEKQQKEEQQQGENGEKDKEQGQGKSKSEKGQEKPTGKPEDGSPADGGGERGSGKPDPNELFKEAYAQAKKKVPQGVPVEGIKKALEEWKKEKGDGDELEQADKAYAKNIGVKPEDLKRYRSIIKSLGESINPETGRSVVEELRELISKIVARRMKPALKPRYPLEEGDTIVDPGALVSEVKGGNLQPKVWETVEVNEQKGQKVGEIEITLVNDRSTSMSEDGGAKLIEQRKASVLFMEALKELADLAEEERVNLETPLEVRSEIYTFQSDASADTIPVKKMSKELGEKEQVEVAALLSSTSGSTTDFVPLETIAAGIDREMERKIADGELKKIVIVFNDGESDDKPRLKKALAGLRKKGVVAVGVGITQAGASVLASYAPDAKLAETAERLPIVLADLLKEHLAEV